MRWHARCFNFVPPFKDNLSRTATTAVCEFGSSVLFGVTDLPTLFLSLFGVVAAPPQSGKCRTSTSNQYRFKGKHRRILFKSCFFWSVLFLPFFSQSATCCVLCVQLWFARVPEKSLYAEIACATKSSRFTFFDFFRTWLAAFVAHPVFSAFWGVFAFRKVGQEDRSTKQHVARDFVLLSENFDIVVGRAEREGGQEIVIISA